MPSDRAIVCPKCGSSDLVEWGTTSRMCRRCHEVFRIDDVKAKPEEPRVEDASRRAQSFLKELESKRLVGGVVEGPDQYVAPRPEGRSERSESQMITIETKGSEAEPESSTDIVKEFEELFKDSSASSESSYSYERREEPKRVYRSQERERQERVSVAQTQVARPKKNKLAGCVVAGAVIAFWILMMIICTVAGK